MIFPLLLFYVDSFLVEKTIVTTNISTKNSIKTQHPGGLSKDADHNRSRSAEDLSYMFEYKLNKQDEEIR